MMKSKPFLDLYLQHVAEQFDHILEVGVYQGGSFVFLDQIFKPKKLSAIELNDIRIPALDEYVEGAGERAKVHYSTSQDDEDKVRFIIERDFDGVLDLVVDDASHFYDQTKSTFKVAFPHLRPGGLYIIEDWRWSFQEPYQDAAHPWQEHHSLANLVVDLMEEMALGKTIQDIEISPHMLKIRKTATPLGQPVMGITARRGRQVSLI
jgi:predicted O-methyltransferase YrrM